LADEIQDDTVDVQIDQDSLTDQGVGRIGRTLVNGDHGARFRELRSPSRSQRQLDQTHPQLLGQYTKGFGWVNCVRT